jgi:prepilin peptidase CpaA
MLVLIIITLFFVLYQDMMYRKIPNTLILVVMLSGLLYTVYMLGIAGIIISFFGISTGLLLLLIPYALGVMAAGDVKLMGAVGAALGPSGVIVAFLYSSIAGGIYAIILMFTGRLGDFPKRLWNTLQTFYYTRQLIYDKPQRPDQQVKLCYGVAIAAGTILYIVLEMTGKGQLVQF